MRRTIPALMAPGFLLAFACDAHNRAPVVEKPGKRNTCGDAGVVCEATPPSTASCVAERCLTTLVTGLESSSIVVNGTGVYWLGMLPLQDPIPTPTIWKVPLDGGTATPFLAEPCGQLAATETSLYCTPTWISVESSKTANNVYAIPLDRMTPVLLATGPLDAGDLAVDARYVYWNTSNFYCSSVPELRLTNSYIMKAPLDGSGGPTRVRLRVWRWTRTMSIGRTTMA